MQLTERQRDILLAGAIGDAIGYRVEFNDIRQIERMYGPQGIHIKHIEPEERLIVSDDTQMTLFTLEALHRLGYDPAFGDIDYEFYKAFMQWFYTQHNPSGKEISSRLAKFASMNHQRAPGMTCLSTLNKKEPKTKAGNTSKGCGGIMRAAPCGFLPTLDSAFSYGAIQAAVTHGHPSGYISAGYFAGLIWGTDNGLSLDDSIIETNKSAQSFSGFEETIDIVVTATRVAKESTGAYLFDIERIGQGWVGEEALGIAIYSVMVAKCFEQALSISINHDGDSDSTGSLAAQLWVSIHGLPQEYKNWDRRLDIADAFTYALNENNYNE